MKKFLLLASLVGVMLFVLFLSLGTAQTAYAANVVVAPSQDVTGTAPATVPATITVPNLEEWMGSAHADASAPAFRHWDAEDPAEVPVECAKCHSSTGYQDYVGADGSAVNVVDSPHPVGTVVDCVACHNSGTITKTSVIMPSGLEITGLGAEARCMECHQGRESKISVDEAISKTAVATVDTVSPDLGFLNIHYLAAAATKYGTLAKGGYEYDGKSYDGNFAHVDGYSTCNECHNSHTLEVKVAECATCHKDVTTVEDLHNVRMEGSQVDYNGNGDVEEGIYAEIEGLQESLLANIQAYASEVISAPVAYSPDAYPYFFNDTNADNTLGDDEAVFPNAFKSWTPRMLKAAYNYQTSIKDPGSYAHGGKYIIELLYDSIDDLNQALAEPMDMTAMNRIDSGHFAGSEEAFRHWDAEGVVPGTCAKCHTPGGLPTFLAEGVNVSAHPSNGLQCSTCHNDLVEFTRYEVKEVKFPSGAVISAENPDTNLCLSCHQGRESSVSVDKMIGDTEPDAQAENLKFINPHYFAAGATLYGNDAKGMYQYAGKTYAGFNKHSGVNQCSDCHQTHALTVDPAVCSECHEEVQSKADLVNIRYNYVDYDGDGDDQEGLAMEESTMVEDLYAAIQAYATKTAGASILYDGNMYPYFFADTNANGTLDANEANGGNAFKNWTPRLLRAAYNYQWATKDPGSFAHNGTYVIQALYDSLEDVGADVSAMTRPE